MRRRRAVPGLPYPYTIHTRVAHCSLAGPWSVVPVRGGRRARATRAHPRRARNAVLKTAVCSCTYGGRRSAVSGERGPWIAFPLRDPSDGDAAPSRIPRLAFVRRRGRPIYSCIVYVHGVFRASEFNCPFSPPAGSEPLGDEGAPCRLLYTTPQVCYCRS